MLIESRDSVLAVIGQAKTLHYALATSEGTPNLAICQYADEHAYYLFTCDSQWLTLRDSWHESIDDAKDQAQFDFPGKPIWWHVFEN